MEGMVRALLEQVLAMDAGHYVATERSLDDGAKLVLPQAEIALRGRMDLVRSDRPGWVEAQIDVVDFKTGGDDTLSAQRMSRGQSLQLGIYLQAVMQAGARAGRVWMIKPDDVSVMSHEELDTALTGLGWLDEALVRGVYGARTPDRSPYTKGEYEWPRACRRVSAAVLQRKFEQTFPDPREEGT
jgi:hypothetical protein